MPAPDEIIALVNRFQQHSESYRSPTYNETQLRREFVDPFFKALGWDIDNEQGYAEAYKDVIHEDSIKIGGSTKAPDYSFCVGGKRKFFVETKKPSVNIRKDVDPAFQLRRYAWSAKLSLSILTDFEELAVYDGRIRPEKNDKASTARTLFFTYDQYEEQWDEIAAIFSRNAVLKGSFDKYAQSNKKKRGTAEVDVAFLDEIEQWRNQLAKNIARRNPDLSQRQLNTAVQKTIDRMIFLRICEDRGIERYGRLQSLLNGPKVYPRLSELFQQADHRYNSGLFHFDREKGRAEPPDKWTLSLTIDDRVLKDILRKLYYPESPYEFSVLSADILGQVYEQFLGKVIRLTKGHQAKVEDKPEVKKAGGVYYTPKYIVDYIVQNTIGKLVEGKAPHEISARTKTKWKPARSGLPLSVLDPACGSGSFLIGAYQYLLDWYRDWYIEHNPAKYKDRIYQTRSDEWRLTTDERKRILLDHIYGVDIDTQAVEVTKLSLLLKVLEGETAETLQRQLFAKQRALPDLADNIKCGNSLIGPDFYTEQKQLDLFDEEERLRINVFDWQAEFVEIMKAGGFDSVIGNPPYVRMEGFKDIKQYLRERYTCHDERSDLYAYFIEKEHGLLKQGGLFGMIVSNKFIRAKYGKPLRGFLESNTTIKTIVDLAGLPVFRGATVRTIVMISENEQGNGRRRVAYSPPPTAENFLAVETGVETLAEAAAPQAYSIPLVELREAGWRLIRTDYSKLLDQLSHDCRSLEAFLGIPICYGVKSGLVDAFVLEHRKGKTMRRERDCQRIIRPYVIGRDVTRYSPLKVEQFIIYTPRGADISKCKKILQHLRPFKARLDARSTRQKWYELQQPQERYVKMMEEPKIIYPDIATECRFTIDNLGQVCGDTTFAIPTRDLALLGILNSRISNFYFKQVCAALEGPSDLYLRFKTQYVSKFPVPSRIPPDIAQSLQTRVQQMLDLHKHLTKLKTAHEQTVLQRQITAVDQQIDQLVYKLYGLTDKEIAIVEEATAR